MEGGENIAEKRDFVSVFDNPVLDSLDSTSTASTRATAWKRRRARAGFSTALRGSLASMVVALCDSPVQ